MSFVKMLKDKNITEVIETPKRIIVESTKETPEDLLRNNNFKIKNIFPTKFGTEYVMAKEYDKDDIKAVLNGFTLKFDDKSIFVVQ